MCFLIRFVRDLLDYNELVHNVLDTKMRCTSTNINRAVNLAIIIRDDDINKLINQCKKMKILVIFGTISGNPYGISVLICSELIGCM